MDLKKKTVKSLPLVFISKFIVHRKTYSWEKRALRFILKSFELCINLLIYFNIFHKIMRILKSILIAVLIKKYL